MFQVQPAPSSSTKQKQRLYCAVCGDTVGSFLVSPNAFEVFLLFNPFPIVFLPNVEKLERRYVAGGSTALTLAGPSTRAYNRNIFGCGID